MNEEESILYKTKLYIRKNVALTASCGTSFMFGSPVVPSHAGARNTIGLSVQTLFSHLFIPLSGTWPDNCGCVGFIGKWRIYNLLVNFRKKIQHSALKIFLDLYCIIIKWFPVPLFTSDSKAGKTPTRFGSQLTLDHSMLDLFLEILM